MRVSLLLLLSLRALRTPACETTTPLMLGANASDVHAILHAIALFVVSGASVWCRLLWWRQRVQKRPSFLAGSFPTFSSLKIEL
jgi:hypothetical protein